MSEDRQAPKALVAQLRSMGYSDRAIREILKWYVSEGGA